ncbi:MAG: hydrolase [Rhodocyclaceae bacterium]
MRDGFHSPWWLPGGHLQTIYPLWRKPSPPTYRRERVDTPDGDFVDFDWLDDGERTHSAPLVVLFHGLEGSSQSHYARSLMRTLASIGWRGVVPHFRGCSGEPNRLLRAYHSGDSDEIDWMLRLIVQRNHGPVYAAGVSLGGNALLKWLGERGPSARAQVLAAAAVCAPLDLSVSGRALERGFNRVYTRHFLDTLIRKAELKHAHMPGGFDVQRARRARSLFEFDDAYTGPVHGFAGANDYWRRASSRPWLHAIDVPTLLIAPRNDPFVPPAALPAASELSSAVSLERPASGGHVGFLRGPWPGTLDWLPQRLLDHFRALSGERAQCKHLLGHHPDTAHQG